MASARLLAGVLLMGTAGACSKGQDAEETAETVQGLKNAASFAGIEDDRVRAQASFTEAGNVLLHARCVNCHPVTERPLQGDARRPHMPPVVRGEDGHGAVGMKCSTCHMAQNAALVGGGSIPGHGEWHLAPASMAWEGRSLSEICEQIKDPERNGGKSLEEIVHHMSEDALVGWAWNPGPGRETPPGNQEVLGGLIRLWVEAGAHCPEPGREGSNKS